MAAFSWRKKSEVFNPPDDKIFFTKYIIQGICQKSAHFHCKLFAGIQLVLLDSSKNTTPLSVYAPWKEEQ